jgi:DNA recombination-dependent growth factor C
MNQNVNTANGVQFSSLGVGTTPSATTGEIRATNNITAYYSDDRLKTRLGNIENALAKVMSLNGFQYEANETAQALGYEVKPEIGLSAQEVQAVLPEVVVPAPIDEKYLTIHYERVIPLLVEAIKELKREIDFLKK